MRLALGVCLLLWFAAIAGSGVAARQGVRQDAAPFAGVLDEHPAIEYATRPTRDPVARLREALVAGKATLDYRQRGGYLGALLETLDLPPSSQLLIFSKTGVQRAHTSPRTPRALYFNDSVVVGYIPGARFLEIAAHDPEQGIVFYTIDQLVTPGADNTGAARAPEIVRRTNCLTCHVSAATLEVPGVIARSVFTDRGGETLPQLGFHLVNHRTPLAERWGGWFVTGNYEAPPYAGVGHLGNVTTSLHPRSGPAATSNEVLFAWLDSRPETMGYASGDSDIAALMLFDHQMHAMNLLTRLNWETRAAASEGRLGPNAEAIRPLANELADYLLFVDEAPPPAQLTPPPGLAERFAARGPRDRRGRSLRELDLQRRLLRYPCSYMIQSDAFDHLPAPAKQAVYERLGAILSGTETSSRYAHLSEADRRAIVEILRDTKSDLPAGWGASSQ